MKRLQMIGVIAAPVLALLAAASYVTTSCYWDDGFPSGAIRLNVRDGSGQPVKGAVLRVYDGGTRDLAFRYPLDNHLPDRELVSDDSGRITAIRKDGGIQFGGHEWHLFWVIRIGAQAPEYECEITAEGYKALRFNVRRLFESPNIAYEDAPKTKLEVDGKEIELKIYEHTFVLDR